MVMLALVLLGFVAFAPIIVPLKGWGYFVRKMGYRKGTAFTFVSMACLAIPAWAALIVTAIQMANGTA